MAVPDFSDPDAAVAFAIAALQNQEEEQAIAPVAAAAARHPTYSRLWQLLGGLHRALDDLALAVAAFEKAARLAPDDPATAHMFARSLLEGGLPAKAQFDRAQALAPEDDIVRSGTVSAMLAENGPQVAIATLQQMLAGRPLWIEGHAQLARLLWASGEREAFARSFEDAVAAAPRDINVWGQYLASLVFAQRYEEVLAVVGRARAAAGAHPMLDLYEANVEDDLGHRAAAARLFDALATLNDPMVALYRIRHLLRARRDREAAMLAERWAATPYGAQILPYLSLAWRLTGDPRWQWLEGDERLIGVYDLGQAAGPLDALAERLRALHVTSGQPLDQSVRGGTQAEYILSQIGPEFRTLRAALVAAVERHIAQLPPDPAHPVLAPPRGRPVRLSGSWSVRLGAAGHHVSHVHPGGWFSSAFYVALPEPEMGGPDHAGWLALGEKPGELGLELPPLRLIEPKPGRLVLFPSTMWHGTRPFGAGERLSVAFDVAQPR